MSEINSLKNIEKQKSEIKMKIKTTHLICTNVHFYLLLVNSKR